MSHIVDLLQEKNTYLEKFHKVNSSEIINLLDGIFDNLDNFYQSRECILSMISSVDRKISESNRGLLSPEEVNDSEKVTILKELDKKTDLVQQILSQDLQVLSIIEREKSSIIKELKQTSISKKAIGSYKTSGENKGSLDESA